MSSGNNMPPELAWAWTDDEKRRLVGRFQTGLYRLLKAFEGWGLVAGDTSGQEVTRDLADRIEKAGTDLDICASNCHALANTLRSYAGVDGVPPATVHAAIRLHKALGASVVLTRTTISQLAGKTLRLEYIEGANAIVQVNGDYWGTPIDRVLVLPEHPDADETPAEAQPVASETDPAFTFRLLRGELCTAIQFLTMTARTGLLSVTGVPGSEKGCLVFADGRVVHAQFGPHADVEAVARMMRLDASVAAFTDRAEDSVRTMNLGTDQLLIEAAVTADELAP